MKISHKLIFSYLSIAVLMSFLGYVSIKIYTDIKHKIIQLNEDSSHELQLSDDILFAIERCQASAHDLFQKKYKIVYRPYEQKTGHKEVIQAERNLKEAVENLARLLSSTRNFSKSPSDSPRANGTREIEDLQQEETTEWLNLKKKRYYYHWKYISYFLHLAQHTPDQAYAFFEKTLEPYYRRNIMPIIDKYKEDAQAEVQIRYRAIVEEYFPTADVIIIVLTLSILFTVSFLAFWISRSVSRPIRQLTGAALEIGKGQLNTKIDIDSKDEIGILASAFNQMAHDLSRTTVSKSYVDNIIKSMLNMLIVIELDGTIAKINESSSKMLGYAENELVGKNIADIIAPDDAAESDILQELTAKGSLTNVEKKYLTKGGLPIPVLFSGSVMVDDEGRIRGIVCVARDIIELKQAETALKKAKDGLEQRVAERTVELLQANAQLQNEIDERRRTEEALRISEEKLRLLSSQLLRAQEKERRRISLELHDELGQSLSLLKVQLSAVKRKLLPDQTELSGALQQIREQMDGVIENVRRLSRDLSPSILEDLGLTAAINWLISDFAKHFRIAAECEVADIDDFFSAEHQIIIYRIFQEILTNIHKHARADRISVDIEQSNVAVSFRVQDNGDGFDFNTVSRQDPTQKGMGLTAMYERALIVGAPLDITSRKGGGTRISFSVPIRNKG